MDLWLRCLKAGCVVVTVRVYSCYNAEGSISESDFVGIRFFALPSNGEVVGPDFYFGIEEHRIGDIGMFDTPESAVIDFESRRRRS